MRERREAALCIFLKFEAKITFLFALCDTYLDTEKVWIHLHME